MPMNTRAQLDKLPLDVAKMFDEVASRYDLMNDLTSLGQVRIWRKAMVLATGAAEGVEILDVAAGTGTSAAAYAKAGAKVVASDFSEGMIEVGRAQYPDLEFVQADALNLPFADESFDVATISYGLRNVHDPRKALREMMRVVRPGGSLVIAEFSTPTWPPFAKLYHFYLERVMPAMSGLFSSDDPAYDYLRESILSWPSQLELAAMIRECGWENVSYRNLSGGIVALHRAVKPE